MKKLLKLSDSKAWVLLTPDEQMALTLSLGQGKSTWEAGELMNKSHYKYLEIFQRASMFLRIFEKYLNTYPTIFRPDTKVDYFFQEYIRIAMLKRLGLRALIDSLPSVKELKKSPLRGKFIISQMAILENSTSPWDKEAYELIHFFDQWNNYRILPPQLQRPSAFQRRNKHRDKAVLTTLGRVSPYQEKTIISKWVKPPLGANNQNIVYGVMIIRNKPRIITLAEYYLDLITKAKIIAFKDKSKASKFIELCFEYLTKDKKHCTDGQKFWPLYRDNIINSINYSQILNIKMGKSEIIPEIHPKALLRGIIDENGAVNKKVVPYLQ